jgi:hypothetical protein
VIIRQAEFAATLVCQYLSRLGFQPRPERPTVLPRWFLLDLGAALQIAWWEQTGVADHIPEPLPDSVELIKEIFAVADDPRVFAEREPDQRLGVRVMATHLRYFAFRSAPFKAAVVLDKAKEDDLIDSLAEFLWNTRNRHVGPGAIGGGES